MPFFPRSKKATLRAATRWSYAVAVALPALAVVILGLTRAPFLPDLSTLLFDSYQRLDPRAWDAQTPVRIVDIDDESLDRTGQWPWPRSTIAEIVTRLSRLGAAAIAVDIVFAEPDGSSPEAVLGRLPPTPGRMALAQEISGDKSNDERLAQAIAATPTVLGSFLTPGVGATDYPAKFGIATAGDDPLPFLHHFTGATVPLPALGAAASGLGALNWIADRDQIVRRVPLVVALGDRIVPSLALEALRVAQGASTIIVRSSNASGQSAFGAHTGVNTIKVGELEIPSDAQAELRVRYTRSEPRRFIPAWTVLAGTVAPESIQGRIIVLGTGAAGLRDQRATPVDASVAGVEVHAQVLEQVLAGAWLTRPDWAPGAELVLAAALALAVALALPRVTAVFGALGATLLMAALGWASWHQFSAQGMLLDPILPGLSIALTYGSGTVWLYRDEQRRRRQVREAFGRYVSPAIVARLAEDPSQLVLGGEIRTLTIMFCDVRGFTAIAERLDAQGLTQFMNEYLTAMSDAVLAHRGTIDKYIGDAVMAFWNAPLDDPDHGRRAARTALAMVEALAVLNHQWQARSAVHHDVRFGIGLATGDCCVGNFGSVHRFDYSVMGDQVNLASRLEGATKFYQTDILASQATRDRAPDFAWLEVDALRVKGKTEIISVHTLAGDERQRQSAAFAMLSGLHARMLAAYRGGDFSSAVSLAGEARGIAAPRLRDLYGAFLERCRALERARPDGWTPVTELAEK